MNGIIFVCQKLKENEPYSVQWKWSGIHKNELREPGFGLQSEWPQETQKEMALRGVEEFFDPLSVKKSITNQSSATQFTRIKKR